MLRHRFSYGYPEVTANCPRYSGNINNVALDVSNPFTYGLSVFVDCRACVRVVCAVLCEPFDLTRLGDVDAPRYELLKGFLGEMAGLFSDEYMHLGGDEVVFGCWFNDPKIAQWAASKGFSHGAQIEQVPRFSFSLSFSPSPPGGRSSFFLSFFVI